MKMIDEQNVDSGSVQPGIAAILLLAAANYKL